MTTYDREDDEGNNRSKRNEVKLTAYHVSNQTNCLFLKVAVVSKFTVPPYGQRQGFVPRRPEVSLNLSSFGL